MKGERSRIVFLLLISYAFYCAWNPSYLILQIVLTSLVFCLSNHGAKTSSPREKTALFIATILVPLCPLVFFKICPLLSNGSSIIVPIGISYYTFKLISYSIDTYLDPNKTEPDYLKFSLYIAFFPQILSGPIQRPSDFLSQLREPSFFRFNRARTEKGVGLILSGMVLKLLLADRLGIFVSQVDASPTLYSRVDLLLANSGYYLELLSDFWGYTQIARGTSLLFGIESPSNFANPISAHNIQEFWRRWHITLTTWMTDYVFMPLGMATRRWGSLGLHFSIAVTFVLIGIWHGISWNFFLYGLIHAIYLSVSLFLPRFPDLFRVRDGVGAFATFVMVSFAFIFFRLPTLTGVVTELKLIANPDIQGGLSFFSGDKRQALPLWLAFTGALAAGMGVFDRLPEWMERKTVWFSKWLLWGVVLLALIRLSPGSEEPFAYFRF